MESCAATEIGFERIDYFTRSNAIRNQIYVDVHFFESSAACLIDRTNPQVIQFVDVMIQLMETQQKMIDCVNIREDDPVITEKVLDGFIKRDVTLGLVNPSLRCSDYARARAFKFKS